MTQLGGSQDKCHLWLERCASVLEFSRAELDSGLESCLCPQAAFREDMRQVASSAALGHIQPLILEDLKVEVSFDMFFGTQFWDPEVDLLFRKPKGGSLFGPLFWIHFWPPGIQCFAGQSEPSVVGLGEFWGRIWTSLGSV